jgi:hypothetical protein
MSTGTWEDDNTMSIQAKTSAGRERDELMTSCIRTVCFESPTVGQEQGRFKGEGDRRRWKECGSHDAHRVFNTVSVQRRLEVTEVEEEEEQPMVIE